MGETAYPNTSYPSMVGLPMFAVLCVYIYGLTLPREPTRVYGGMYGGVNCAVQKRGQLGTGGGNGVRAANLYYFFTQILFAAPPPPISICLSPLSFSSSLLPHADISPHANKFLRDPIAIAFTCFTPEKNNHGVLVGHLISCCLVVNCED